MNIQRQFGKLTVKGAGNDAKVQVLLNDFEEADKCLMKLVEAVKTWRDTWKSMLAVQVGTITEFQDLYKPIIGSSDDHSSSQAAQTSESQLHRVARLGEVYTELKTDLLHEVDMMDSRLIQPAVDAREYIKPMKKVVKKHDDKRLDYERYQDKVNSLSKKDRKSDRDVQAYAKAQEDLAKSADAFRTADENIRLALPPLIAACFSLLPHLLAAQIITQNTLLGQYYTVLHTYCTEEGFQSPPPSMDIVISTWESSFKHVQEQIEGTALLARGKAVHASMHIGDDKGSKSITGFDLRAKYAQRRNASQENVQARPGSTRIPSTKLLKADDDTPSRETSPGLVANFASKAPAGPGQDYFQTKMIRSSSATQGEEPSAPTTVVTAARKKPPPPPPKRRQEQWVVALYEFTGQEAGDLSFAEGQRIRVIKKSDSLDDWWEGEINGIKGKFPANYCQPA